MKGSILRVALSLATSAILCWGSPAIAYDSTQGIYFTPGSGSGITSSMPTVQAGSPYLVDQGTAWIGGFNPSDNSYGGIDEGYLEIIGNCQPEVLSPPNAAHEAYCVVRGITRPFNTDYSYGNNQPEICPIGFRPKVTIKSEVPVATNTAPIAFACPLPRGLSPTVNIPTNAVGDPIFTGETTGPFANRFWIYAVVSAQSITEPAGPRLYPGNGFSFEINCVPTNNPMMPFRTPNTDCYKPIRRDKMPILLETGMASVTPNYVRRTPRTFDTRLICPQGQTPYIQITMAAPDNYNANVNNFELLNSFSYCVQRMSPNGSNNAYTVSYLFAATRTNINKSASSLTVNDPDRGAAKTFLNLQWRLYCYPLGLTPPVDYTTTTNGLGGNCNPNNPPYDQ